MFEKPIYNFFYSLVLVLITAAFCSYFNNIGMESFYSSISLSSLTPPDYVFPLVWIFLYVLLTISFDFVLNAQDKTHLRQAAQLFTTNLFLQVVWTYVFFYNGYFFVGLTVLVLLDLVTIWLIYMFYKIHKLAAWLLLPYFLWLLFATYLNWAVVELNGYIYSY